MQSNDESDVSKKMQKHNKQIQLAESIEGVCGTLIRELQNTDYTPMDTFKPFINPKENISKLLEFYEVYSDTLKNIEKIRIEIERSPIENNPSAPISIKSLDELGILSLLEDYKKHLLKLSNYSDVNIVKSFVSESDEYYRNIVDKIKLSFLNALSRLPKVIDNIHLYAKFLLKNIPEKELTMEYTKQIHAKMGFYGISNNFKALVSATSNLTQYFNLIISLNTKILGKRVSQNINIGLVSLMIINLKKKMCDHLLKVEKDPKGSDIPLLINLWRNLKHSDGPMIKEIEDLFELKDQIKKLILNCLIHFLADLELIENPNKDLVAEKENIVMDSILKSFKENKILRDDWVSKYGPSFGVYKSHDLPQNFAGKCLLKTGRLAEELQGFNKYIYLINNKFIFKNHIKQYDGMSLKDSILKDCHLIVGIWRIDLENRQGLELNRYLKKEFERHSQYYLPDEQRKIVQDELREIVEDLIVRRLIQGQTSQFKELVEGTYAGKK